MPPILSPADIAALTVLRRPVMLAGAGVADGWLLFKDGTLIDLWVRMA
jgi:hypothetical protein